MRARLPALLLLSACQPGPEPAEVFAAEVVPVFDRSCGDGSCHGVGPDGAWPDGATFAWSVDGEGRVVDVDEAREAALTAVDATEPPRFSPLLRKPLDPAWGGLPHYGGTNFVDTDDPDYAALAGWIALEPAGGLDPEPLDPLEQQFADEVQPVLVGLTCAGGACHGPTGAIPFRLDPGLQGGFSTTQTRANHEQARSMIAVDADPLQSRLLRKALPLHAGGMRHKGGNDQFLQGLDDPRLQPILDWIAAERLEHLGAQDPPAAPASIVFVRGPLAPAHPFDLDVYVPGTDLHRARLDDALQPTGVDNLTAGLHDGAGDARDPAVHPDGDRVAFALRPGPEAGHDLWVLDLADGDATRLTDDAGPLPGGGLCTHREPAWGPDETLWFVSTCAGVVAEDGQRLDADLYALHLDTGEVRRRTRTPHVEREPAFLVRGEEAGGEIAFTALRDAVPSEARAHPFRFPPGLATEYHQHFGITPPEDLVHDLAELPDGNYVVVLGSLEGVWGGGRLGVVDRNFGPAIPPRATPALPRYLEPLVRLDTEAAAAGTTGSFWRDPAPLPDGRLLAAWAPGPLDLADPAAEVDTAVVLATLAEAPDGTGPALASREVVIDAPGVADFDPVPVVERWIPPLREPWSWEPAADTGVLHHQGLPMIDALLAHLPPTGPRPVPDDLVAVRLVETLPVTPAQRQPLEVAGHPAATTTSLGPHGPARILAELPLAADGSFQAEIPAGVAFRIQGLDADGVAVSVPHNRWFDMAPGQTLPQGVQPGHYPALCAPCHGALDGDPDHAFEPAPDALTAASVTLGRYQGADPSRPLPPAALGEGTRIEVDFREQVRPVLDRACGDCHGGSDPAAGLSLSATPTEHFDAAYVALLARGEDSLHGQQWVDAVDGTAWGSHLAEVISGRELGAPGALAEPGTRHPADLSDADLQTLIRWMDLGATWVGAP